MSIWQLATARSEKDPVPARLESLRGTKGGRIGGLWFAAIVAGLLGFGMVGLLALNVSIQNTQLQLNAAQRKATALGLQVSDRQAQIYVKAAPGQLAVAATELGMVPNANLAYVDLRSGKVLGTPKAATGSELPALRTHVLPGVSGPSLKPVASNVQGWTNLAPPPVASTPNVPASSPPAATTKKN